MSNLRIVKNVSLIAHKTATLDEWRAAVAKDIVSVPEVTIKHFEDCLLPPVLPGLVEKTFKCLQKCGDYTKGTWKSFPWAPMDSPKNENKTFAHLPTLAGDIVKAVQQVFAAEGIQIQPSHFFCANPDRAPMSQRKASSSHPDSYVSCHNRRRDMRWVDIFVSAEFKLEDNDANLLDDITKVLWSMSQALRDDPCRRHTLGLTIENTTTRFWFSSRSDIIVSKPFNFISSPKRLIHFFISVLFARPFELGLDPTMSPTDDGQHDITVQSADGERRIYHTLELISDIGADSMQGKGTRVWRAVQIENGRRCNSEVIVKDVWVDEHMMREGDISKAIYMGQQKAEWKAMFKERFLTVDFHGDVYIDTGDSTWQLDHTLKLIMRGHDVPRSCSRLNVVSAVSEKVATSKRVNTMKTGAGNPVPHRNGSREPPALPPDYGDKVHYRIVFADVCRPLHDEVYLPTIMLAISEAYLALRMMHDAGWVHRDISTGNILVGPDGHARLGDLEYAVQMEEEAKVADTVLTASQLFVSVEVHTRSWHFSRKCYDDPIPVTERTALERFHRVQQSLRSSTRREPRQSTQPASHTMAPFKYNPLHDLESLWWVATYFLVWREVVARTRTAKERNAEKARLHQQRLYAETLFTESGKTTLLEGGFFMPEFSGMFPKEMQTLREKLDIWRHRLVLRYAAVESDIPAINHEAAMDLGLQVLGLLSESASSLRGVNITPLPRSRTLRKRKIDA